MKYYVYPEDPYSPTQSFIVYIEGTEQEVRKVDREIKNYGRSLLRRRGRRSYRVNLKNVPSVLEILEKRGEGYVSPIANISSYIRRSRHHEAIQLN